MAPSISGHGGEFELEEGGTVPTIDFTVPPPPRQVMIVDRESSLRDAILKPRDPKWDPPAGVSITRPHPNDHDREGVVLQLQTLVDQPYDEETGAFRIQSGGGKAQLMDLPYCVRYYRKGGTNQSININAQSGLAVKLENFGMEEGQYIAVVLYNFQEWQGPSSTGHDKIRFQTDTGIKEEADRDCYVYITIASADAPNPQHENHPYHSLKDARLYINLNKIAEAMGESGRIGNGDGETLYHAAASAINNDMLTFGQHEITLTTVTTQDEVVEQNGDITFSVDSAGGSEPLKLGIYLVAKAPSGASAQVTLGDENPDETATLVDLNSATPEALDALQGIGPVLAERIIVYRNTKPFTKKEELMIVQGIGQVTYDRISHQIQVLPA